jgi:hypothetical protein
MFRKAAITTAGLVVALVIAAQFKTVEFTNPPSKGDLAAPPEVEAILRHACYDCHSNETRWPWYSAVAPFSWEIVHHVELGRKEMNFSEWGGYYPNTRQRKLEWMRRALQEEVMPPWSYRLMHPGARLTDDDRARLVQWIDTELAGPASGQRPNN